MRVENYEKTCAEIRAIAEDLRGLSKRVVALQNQFSRGHSEKLASEITLDMVAEHFARHPSEYFEGVKA